MKNSDFKIAYFPGIDGTGLFNKSYYAYLREMGYSVKEFTYPVDKVLTYDQKELFFLKSLESSDKPWFIIGESFGGPLAAKLAHRLGSKCIGLGQIVTFHHAPLPCASVLSPLMGMVPSDWIPNKFIELWFRTFTGNPEHLRIFQHVQERVPKAMFHHRARETLQVDTQAIIKQLNIPIGVLHADSETILLNPSSRKFQHLNPLVQEMTIEGSHLLLAQKPLDVAVWTHQFIQSKLIPGRSMQSPCYIPC